MNLLFSLLSKSHDRKGFSCGNTALDTYLQKQARQDAQRGFSTVIVATEEENPERIIGYYTLAAASVALDRLPEETRKALPRYQDIPSILLGRLAVSNAFQRQHIGSLLVFDALRRSLRNELAWAFFLVQAKNEQAKRFYIRCMFQSFQDTPMDLWMYRAQALKVIGS